MNLMESLLANKLAAKQSSGGSDLTPAVKTALLDCFANVAWATEDGQQYYDALADALYGLQSISAVYTKSGTVYDTDSLDSLKADLVVTALYGDGSTQTVPAESYTLSGTLTEGTSTITVSYGGKTTTFDVTVSTWVYNWDYTMGDPTEHGFATTTDHHGSALFVAGVGEKLSVGQSGSASLHPSVNFSAQHGIVELVVVPSVISTVFQGLVMIASNGTNGFRVRLYKNSLYYGSVENTEATDTKIANITEGQEYKFRFEWSSGGVDVEMDGVQIYHGEYNSTSQRVVVTQTGAGSESIIKAFRIAEVA